MVLNNLTKEQRDMQECFRHYPDVYGPELEEGAEEREGEREDDIGEDNVNRGKDALRAENTSSHLSAPRDDTALSLVVDRPTEGRKAYTAATHKSPQQEVDEEATSQQQ